MCRYVIVGLTASLFAAAPSGGAAADAGAPLAERFLVEGRLAEGEAALAAVLEGTPGDAQARFGLGVIRFLRGVERLGQAFYRHGLRSEGSNLVPFLRLPLPANPDPRPIRHEDLRGIFADWLRDMALVEATLAEVADPGVKLPLHFGLIRLDLDGDGRAGDEETLWTLYARLNRGAGDLTAEKAATFVIGFDAGDVAWLRGYCHLLSALAEVYLAHDSRDLFERAGHLAFARPETPFAFLRSPTRDPNRENMTEILDLVATVHLIRLPVAEPARMAAALGHLEAMVGLSRDSWRAYLAETDDDREWIPNPRQSTVVPGVRVTDEMVKGWQEFLDEAEALLAGKLLAPFWRDPGGSRGINLRRVFTEPTTLDLVLWVQGTAAAPYLEEGSITRPEVWGRLQRVFGGEFIGFALWFN